MAAFRSGTPAAHGTRKKNPRNFVALPLVYLLRLAQWKSTTATSHIIPSVSRGNNCTSTGGRGGRGAGGGENSAISTAASSGASSEARLLETSWDNTPAEMVQ